MNRITIRDDAYHTVITWLWRETRRGNFPEAFARLWADARLAPDEYGAIGRTLDTWLRKRQGKVKDKAIASLALAVSQWLGLRGRPGDDRQREMLVEALWFLSDSHDESKPLDAKQYYSKVPGHIAGVATLLLGNGVSAETLAHDPAMLARVALSVCETDGLPVSITDVIDTLAEMTKFGPITDWVVPEEVERLRGPMRERLVALLNSPEAPSFLRVVICRPSMAKWLAEQMETKAEKDHLRAALLTLRSDIATAKGR